MLNMIITGICRQSKTNTQKKPAMRDDENYAATTAILKTRSPFDTFNHGQSLSSLLCVCSVVMLVGFQQDLPYNQITVNPSCS